MAESLDPRAEALRRPPPLALLSALAALVDLSINRIAVHAAAELVDATTVLGWMRFGALPRNLAAVAGLGALFASLVTYLRMPGFASVWLRLPIALFAGILMPSLILATVLPRERMLGLLVLFGMFATHALVALLAAAAIVYRSRSLRWALAIALATAVQALVVLAISSLRQLLARTFGAPIAWTARHLGELCWLCVPLAIAPAVFPSRWTRRDRLAAGLGALVVAVAVALAIAGEATLHPDYSTVMYGAFRVAMLPEEASIAYAIPPAIGLGAASLAIASADPWRRQVGAAVVFWLAAGYSPRSPIQLLDLVLAVVLLARAAQAADPEGLRRATLLASADARTRPSGQSSPGDPTAPEPAEAPLES